MYKNKNILFILCLVFLICLVGCTNNPSTNVVDEPTNNKEQLNDWQNTKFNAKILEILDNSILVQPMDGANELNSSDKIYVNTKDVNVDFNLLVGQVVMITYDGLIAESYPAQILGVKNIELISNNKDSAKNDINDADNIQEQWGVTLEAQNVTSGGLTVVCHQLGGEDISELSTGSFYTIQKLEDYGFVDVEYLPHEYDIGWTMEAYIINKDATTTWDINWEWLYGKLPDGEYRIGKEIMNFRGPGDYDQKMIYAHFTIQE